MRVGVAVWVAVAVTVRVAVVVPVGVRVGVMVRVRVCVGILVRVYEGIGGGRGCNGGGGRPAGVLEETVSSYSRVRYTSESGSACCANWIDLDLCADGGHLRQEIGGRQVAG